MCWFPIAAGSAWKILYFIISLFCFSILLAVTSIVIFVQVLVISDCRLIFRIILLLFAVISIYNIFMIELSVIFWFSFSCSQLPFRHFLGRAYFLIISQFTSMTILSRAYTSNFNCIFAWKLFTYCFIFHFTSYSCFIFEYFLSSTPSFLLYSRRFLCFFTSSLFVGSMMKLCSCFLSKLHIYLLYLNFGLCFGLSLFFFYL